VKKDAFVIVEKGIVLQSVQYVTRNIKGGYVHQIQKFNVESVKNIVMSMAKFQSQIPTIGYGKFCVIH
jgi:hypothetical protein